MFDWKKPTVQMLGRWQPWHDGHQALFKRCVAKTGQVIIQVRDVQGASGGKGQDDNPFDWDQVCKNIEDGLIRDNFVRGKDYEIMMVPNIVNITYGRGVGYAFDEEVFDEATHSISATKIRKKLKIIVIKLNGKSNNDMKLKLSQKMGLFTFIINNF